MNVVVAKQKGDAIRVFFLQRDNLFQLRENLPRGDLLVLIRVQIVAQENDVLLPEVLVNGLFPKVPSVYVRYDNHLISGFE